ncbi:MAG: Fe-S cluster assembly protein SufD [Verrucomicrobia subdivision 3 bacterium]|nr:Fe-S cluster assembly protein SufD [Limisphaerales bacterium]
MVAPANNAVDRLLAALPMRGEGGARFAELGFPTTRDEDWRFTSVAPIAELDFTVAESDAAANLGGCVFSEIDGPQLVFVNGLFSGKLSRVGELPAGVEVGNVGDVAAEDLESAEGEGAFGALNAASYSDGAIVRVADDVSFGTPIRIYYLSTGSDGATSNIRNHFTFGANSKATILESWTSASAADAAYFNNVVTKLSAGDNAQVEHVKFQNESPAAFHVAGLRASMGRDSRVAHHSIALGGRIARNNIRARLDGTGIEALLNGLYLPCGKQLIDHHMVVDHLQPHCDSHEYFNGILDDHARAVFHGRIHVHKGADKTDAKQTNKNLLLSDNATVNTKPQLEIYADDVKCTHGATIGQMNAEQIFYLRARGLDEESARRMIMHAFAGEIIARIGCTPAREELDGLVWDRLEDK